MFHSLHELFERARAMSKNLKIGEIPYLNLFPIFTALRYYFDIPEIEFVRGHPSELNMMLREKKVDISPSSSIEYGRHFQRYILIPDMSVSSREKIKSVLLFSPFKIEESSSFTAYATSNSDTSITLLKIVLLEFLKKDFRVITVDSPREVATHAHEPYLLIGDEAIRESLDNSAGKEIYQYDLGAIWKEHTGLPFVFALWIVNEDSYRDKKWHVKKISRKLLDAKRISLQMIRYRNESILGKEDYPFSFLNEYWNNLSYDLELELEGLKRFFELSHHIGEIDHIPEMKFIELL